MNEGGRSNQKLVESGKKWSKSWYFLIFFQKKFLFWSRKESLMSRKVLNYYCFVVVLTVLVMGFSIASGTTFTDQTAALLAPSSFPTMACPAIANASITSAMKIHSCIAIW